MLGAVISSARRPGRRADRAAVRGPVHQGRGTSRVGQPALAGRADAGAVPDVGDHVLTGIAGLTMLLRAGGGLYWLIPAVLAGLAGGVINAWLFLLRVPSTADAPRP
jgi:hypothetical protein